MPQPAAPSTSLRAAITAGTAPRPWKIAFTADLIQAWRASPPTAWPADTTVWDALTPGLGLRFRRRPDGSAGWSWVVRHRPPGAEAARYPLQNRAEFLFTLAEARKAAARAVSGLIDGLTPSAQRRQRRQAVLDAQALEAHTWAVVMRAYGPRSSDDHALDSTEKDRALAATWVERAPESCPGLQRLAKTSLAEVKIAAVGAAFAPLFRRAPETAPAGARPGGVVAPFGPLRSRASALKLLRHCRAAWNDATGPKADANPFAAWASKNRKAIRPPTPRSAYLLIDTDPTVPAAAAAWRWLLALLAARQGPERTAADWMLLCLLWGARTGEVAALRWERVLTDDPVPQVLFDAPTTKTRVELRRPLAPWAAQILQERRALRAAEQPSPWVLPSPVPGTPGPITACKALLRRLNRAAGPGTHFTPHDLRRTMSGGAYEAGLASIESGLAAAGSALSHRPGSAVTPDYINRVVRLRALRSIYSTWEHRLRTFCGLPPLDGHPLTLPPEHAAALTAVIAVAQSFGVQPSALAAWLTDPSLASTRR